MMARVILYEYPFNERTRTSLRLEHLFRRVGELVPRSHPIDHHYALATIFEVMDVAAGADLKSEGRKDLQPQKKGRDGARRPESGRDEGPRAPEAGDARLARQPGNRGGRAGPGRRAARRRLQHTEP